MPNADTLDLVGLGSCGPFPPFTFALGAGPHFQERGEISAQKLPQKAMSLGFSGAMLAAGGHVL